jgi:hypothetical protein
MTRSLLILALLATPALAELPEAARVPNIGGYCSWASLDSLARANDVQPLVGILGDRRASGKPVDPGYDSEIIAELKARGVRYEFRPHGSYDREVLYRHAETSGVMVAIMAGNSAAKDTVIADLQKQVAALETRAAQAVQPDAPSGSRETGASDAYSKPAATSLLGVRTLPAALVAYPSQPSARSQQCSGGTCQPAAQPKRYVPMRRKALLPWRR